MTQKLLPALPHVAYSSPRLPGQVLAEHPFTFPDKWKGWEPRVFFKPKAKAEIWGHHDYGRSKFHSLELLRAFPPRNHAYVLAGRSPTWLLAFLEQTEGVQVASLPISGLGRLKGGLPSDEAIDSFFRHFNKYVPAHIRNGSRTLVTVDAFDGRNSLKTLERLMRMKGDGEGQAIYGFDLTSQLHDPPYPKGWVVAPHNRAGHFLDCVHSTMRTSEFEFVAKHGQADWEHLDDLRLPVRPEYVEFKREMGIRMANDPTLPADLALLNLDSRLEAQHNLYTQAVAKLMANKQSMDYGPARVRVSQELYPPGVISELPSEG